MTDFVESRYEIYSEKHGIAGVVSDNTFFCSLYFTVNGKETTLTIDRPFPFTEETVVEHGKQVMETYVERLQTAGIEPKLYYWYIKKEDEDVLLAWGNVSGHGRLQDSLFIHTSLIKEVYVDNESEELVITTLNSRYHCPLLYCNFSKQDEDAEIMPDYEEIKKKYQGKRKDPSIEPGKVLLVLSNYDKYYFHSLFYQEEGGESPENYRAQAHIGMFQDSYIIMTESGSVDLRYFPHAKNIHFYSEHIQQISTPWFIENIGDSVLFARTSCGVLRIAPGERIQVRKENALKEEISLPDGDLYPPVFMI